MTAKVHVLRLAFALQGFAAKRDELYAIFSLTVLTVLFVGLTGHAS